MATDVYEKLAKHLDNLPGGFPQTKSGVEMRILEGSSPLRMLNLRRT